MVDRGDYDLSVETPIAFSVRGLSRRSGISREVFGREIKAGRLRASLISKHRYVVLHSDFEAWLRLHAVRPDDDAAHVARLLAREARS